MLGLALVPVKDCEGLFQELGGMQPSATALSNLAVTMGSAWGVVQDGRSIRIEEGIPAEAVTMAVAVDGDARDAQGERRARARECATAGGLPGGVVGNFRCTMPPGSACVRCVTAGCRRPGKCP